MHCCSPLGVPESMKMFLEPKEYMRWRDTHFLPPCCHLGQTMRAYVLFCTSTIPLFGALCVSKNRTHKFMRHVLHYHNEIHFICLYKSKAWWEANLDPLNPRQYAPSNMPCYLVFESWNPVTPLPQVISHYNYSLSCSYSHVKHLEKYPSLWKEPYIYEYLLYERTYTYSLRGLVARKFKLI